MPCNLGAGTTSTSSAGQTIGSPRSPKDTCFNKLEVLRTLDRKLLTSGGGASSGGAADSGNTHIVRGAVNPEVDRFRNVPFLGFNHII